MTKISELRESTEDLAKHPPFGKLTVIRKADSERAWAKWLCRCECGNEIIVGASFLLKGRRRSCGCTTHRSRFRHGLAGTKEYTIWGHMIQRCTNPKNKRWHDYGGRGITVCDRWRGPDGFLNFLADMGKCPDGMTLEREDNDKGYDPSNCKWATTKQQSRNKRSNRMITFNGKTQTLMDWSKELGVSWKKLDYRVKKWGIERAMTSPDVIP